MKVAAMQVNKKCNSYSQFKKSHQIADLEVSVLILDIISTQFFKEHQSVIFLRIL